MANYKWNGLQIAEANRRMAAGEVNYPDGTTVERVEDGVVITLSGKGAAARFSVDAGGNPVRVTKSNGDALGSVFTATAAAGWIGSGWQWYRNGVAISGATASTYTRVQADSGCTISVVATGIPFSASLEIPTSVVLEFPGNITPMLAAIKAAGTGTRFVANWMGMSIVAGVGANNSVTFGASQARTSSVAPLIGAALTAALGGVQSLGMEEVGYSGSGSLWSYSGSPVPSLLGSQGPDGYEVNLAGAAAQSASITVNTTRVNQVVRLYGRVVGGAGVITPRYSMSGANTLATTNLPASTAAAPLPAGTSWWYEISITIPVIGSTLLSILPSVTSGHNLAIRGADLDYYISSSGFTIHRLARSGMGMGDLLASSLDDTDTQPAGNWIGNPNLTRRQAQALSMTSRITGAGFDWVSTDVNDIQHYASFGYTLADIGRHLDNFIADQLANGRYTLFIAGLGLRDPSSYTGSPPYTQADIIALIRTKCAASARCALIDNSGNWQGATLAAKYAAQIANQSWWIPAESPSLHPAQVGHAGFAALNAGAILAALP